jgi:hypothetical protein
MCSFKKIHPKWLLFFNFFLFYGYNEENASPMLVQRQQPTEKVQEVSSRMDTFHQNFMENFSAQIICREAFWFFTLMFWMCVVVAIVMVIMFGKDYILGESKTELSLKQFIWSSLFLAVFIYLSYVSKNFIVDNLQKQKENGNILGNV